jgi:hypothetical protein
MISSRGKLKTGELLKIFVVEFVKTRQPKFIFEFLAGKTFLPAREISSTRNPLLEALKLNKNKIFPSFVFSPSVQLQSAK